MENIKNLKERIEDAIQLIIAYKRNDCDNETIKYFTIQCCPDSIQQELILNLLVQEKYINAYPSLFKCSTLGELLILRHKNKFEIG